PNELNNYRARYIQVLEDFEFYCKCSQDVFFVFRRKTTYKMLKEAAEYVGLDGIGTHTMRKTFGYWHYKKFKDVALLQEIFNHSSPDVTLRYIGITQDTMDQTMDAFIL
ncbi:tyrosine-type recombinase/integrase, partial [Bacillus licheniformis]|uniref:tyrosine-type recombinase/integrase n=1 Tax=Bacillus licheniformis TaxID=1402 RepID=UPI00237C8CE1